MRRGMLRLFGWAVLMVGTSTVPADTVQVPADRDNTLHSETTPLSNGAGDHLFAGRIRGPELRRGLVRFDLTGVIPAGSTVTSVRLELQLSRTRSNLAQTVHAHALNRDWGEAGSDAAGEEGQGAPAQPGDATWEFAFFDSDGWTTTGGDFQAIPSASVSVGPLGRYTWGSTPELVADVQRWVNSPATNHGWILIGNEAEEITAKRFNTREHPDGATHPLLIVEFAPPPLGAGSIPGGVSRPGNPLLIDRGVAGALQLDWSASCYVSDGDYAIYEGELDLPGSHQPLLCTTAGALSATVQPSAGNRYYLVVPLSAIAEGSYGRNGDGVERGQGFAACAQQLATPCP